MKETKPPARPSPVDTLRTLAEDSTRRTFALFRYDYPLAVDGGGSAATTATEDDVDEQARLTKLRAKFNLNYRTANDHIGPLREKERESRKRTTKTATAADGTTSRPVSGTNTATKRPRDSDDAVVETLHEPEQRPVVIDPELSREIEKPPESNRTTDRDAKSTSSTVVTETRQQVVASGVHKRLRRENAGVTNALAIARDRPEWHAPWRLYRVLMGHLGWVRSVAVDPGNEWFCTGSADRTIKIWDLASGRLKLTLTGHIGSVRALCISDRHPYMFSAGDDKQVKCWDLEYNKVIRHYHGHLSGVYSAALHPSLDTLVTGGRDATVRVWDIRTKAQIFALGGHRDAVNSLQTQKVDPQIISASADSTLRLWDLAAGKCFSTLTNHKKGVRAVAVNPREFSFASASADNIKTWELPKGDFMRNLSGHNVIVNSLSVNEDGVLVSGGDDGSIGFWDYRSAHEFYRTQTQVQPGSLDCEAGIFGSAFDMTGTRLITVETDKTVKMWKEDEKATPETHPLNWTPNILPKRY